MAGEKWELINRYEGGPNNLRLEVSRFPVPGGWIYRTAATWVHRPELIHVSTVYVPEPKGPVVATLPAEEPSPTEGGIS